MGYRNECCRCPEAWCNYVNRWVYVCVAGECEGLLGPWQLMEVHEDYIVLRRSLNGTESRQRAVVRCKHIVALIEYVECPVV